MGWFTKIGDFFGFETVRNRDKKGRYVADDKSTPDVDESKKRVYKSKENYYSKEKNYNQEEVKFWGDSSVGRALPLHGRGRRFDPCSLHHYYTRKIGRVVECTCLENKHTFIGIEGSNPSSSATFKSIRSIEWIR